MPTSRSTRPYSRVSGTVVVGVQPIIAQEWLTPALPRFNALYPDVQLDIRYFMRPIEEQTRGVDVMLVMGWPSAARDLVRRQLGATSFFVCAAPSYWATHGMPKHPSELKRHNCLCIRSTTGSVMDLWRFKRGDERVSVSCARLARLSTTRTATWCATWRWRVPAWRACSTGTSCKGARSPAVRWCRHCPTGSTTRCRR